MVPNHEVEWNKKFQKLCYEVFLVNKEGAELLKHMELKYFRSPVAYPNQESSWAYFNEGRNEHIRQYTIAIQNYLNQANKTKKPKSK